MAIEITARAASAAIVTLARTRVAVARRGVTERADGNAEVAQSTFSRANGQLGRVADVLLAYQQIVE